MFKRILVPLDGSKRAEQALPVAARLAHGGSGSIVLVRARPSHLLQTPLREPSQVVLERAEAARAGDEAYLTEVSQRELFEGTTIEVSALTGSPAEVILAAAEETAADLIVLCSHGRSAVTRWALGSVAQKVCRHAPVPVLVVRGGDHGHDLAGEHHPMRVLVGLDGSALAEAAVLPAAALVRGLSVVPGGTLQLMRVIEPWLAATGESTNPAAGEMIDATIAEANTYLQELAGQIQGHVPASDHLTITWSVAVDSDVAQALLSASAGGPSAVAGSASNQTSDQRFDLIALATHGRTGLARWALGSMTERVLHATRHPLLIVRVPASAQDESPFDNPLLAEEIVSWPDAN